VYRREESAKVWKQKQSDAGRGIGAPEGEEIVAGKFDSGERWSRGVAAVLMDGRVCRMCGLADGDG
jgi:hypothetical protein